MTTTRPPDQGDLVDGSSPAAGDGPHTARPALTSSPSADACASRERS